MDRVHRFSNIAQRKPIDNKNAVIVLVLRVGRGREDTSREGRNEGRCLEFAGDVRMVVGKRDSGLGLWRNETLLT